MTTSTKHINLSLCIKPDIQILTSPQARSRSASVESFSCYTPSVNYPNKPLPLEKLALLSSNSPQAKVSYTMLNKNKPLKDTPLPETSAPNFSNFSVFELKKRSFISEIICKIQSFYFKLRYHIIKGFQNLLFCIGCCGIKHNSYYFEDIDNVQHILYLILLVFFGLNFLSPIYGIYGGIKLYSLWSEIKLSEINGLCYELDIIYDVQNIFWLMVICGILQYLLCFIFLILRICVNQKDLNWIFALFATIINIGWIIDFVFCLVYYLNMLGNKCMHGSYIYVETMIIYAWFLPLVIFEIAKWGIFILFLLICYCCSFGDYEQQRIKRRTFLVP